MNKPAITGFTISKADHERIRQWLRGNGAPHRCVPDSFGGLLTYAFTPCGIGDTVKVTCPCGLTLDLTDVESW